jgi:hypothetical protein
VREVIIDEDVMRDRFVICRNPEAAERDRAIRENLLAQLAAAIDGSDRPSTTARVDLATGLPAWLGRFLRRTPGGLLRVDRATVRAEERLDGSFLAGAPATPPCPRRTSALGYKHLLEIERGWRDMKSSLELRPVFHRLEHRIRAHVVLCWLDLPLIHVAEQAPGDTWRNLRHELDRMHLGTFTGPAGTVRRRTATTAGQTTILRAWASPNHPSSATSMPPHHSRLTTSP